MENKFEKVFLGCDKEDLLAEASYKGEFDQVLLMLKKDEIDVNALILHNNKHVDGKIFEGYKTTALHCAASQGHDKIAGLLIEHGAKTDIKDSNNYTAAARATLFGHYETVELLINKDASGLNTLLFIAATNNYLKIAGLLIKHGADVNYIYNDDGARILHELAYYDYVEMLELLIKHGANINHTEAYEECTPLIKSILINDSDDNYDINKFTQYLLEYPNTTITTEIIQPVLESYINESIIKIIKDITKCEMLYKKSNIEELYAFFQNCSPKVQNVFLKRQENKFNPNIKYFNNKNHLYDELKNLEKFVSNDPALKSLNSIISQYYNNDFLTLKGLTLVTVKLLNIECADIPNSLIKDLDNCITVEKPYTEEVTTIGDL